MQCFFYDIARSKEKEQGNSLIEVLVALSLFTLMVICTSMLAMSAKSLEKKSRWQLIAQMSALSIVETGMSLSDPIFNSNGLENPPVIKNNAPLFWQTELRKHFPNSDIRLEVNGKEESSNKGINCSGHKDNSNKKNEKGLDKKTRLKISPLEKSYLNALEFEF